jgi:hypothetical protein
MRREDTEKLQQPYPTATPINDRFADALGVTLPAARDLHREVFADFDETAYGIGWWTPHPGTSRRILIGDQLLMCIAGIETNLVEARLHLLELADFDEQEDRIVAHAVKHDRQGRPSVKMPERTKPADDLPHLMAALHIAGFFRAVGSALDCLGGAIIGVLALPASILKADIDKAISSLDKVKNPVTAGGEVQVAFQAELAALIASAGPAGWLPWTTDHRNMLVHRGRRLQPFRLEKRGAVLLAADSSPVVLARAVRQLAQDPGLSDVEAFASARAPVLTEDSKVTLKGVIGSALALSETTAASLVQIWRRRRSEPTLLAQPKEQWPQGRSTASRGFAGYKPGTVPFNIDWLVSNPTFVKRLKVAALDTSARKKWDTFD